MNAKLGDLMATMVDLRVFEILSSRLCHDIVGPVGAVNNGMEILEDDDPEMTEDALALVANSARQASDALQFYRLAYGMAGSQLGNELSDTARITERYLAKSKAILEWSQASLPLTAPGGTGKLLLNMIALAAECLPRGGSVSVSVRETALGAALMVVARGQSAAIREELAGVFEDGMAVEDLSPRNVQGYFTARLARALGSPLQIASEPDRVIFEVEL